MRLKTMIKLEISYLKFKINKLFYRLKILLKYGRKYTPDQGFTQLMYRGKPVLLRDYVPKHEVWFVDDSGKITSKLNIETGEVRELDK